MSLLEDIFLQDEANEAQELEKVIEGDEYDERPRSLSPSGDESDSGGKREDEAEEDKRRVDPSSTKTKRVVKNPRFILNPARLTGPRGIQIIPEHFKDFKFRGKGHEKEDLDLVLKKLEHWAYRLYPKFQFADCLKKIETLGKKRPVMVHLHKIRTDQFLSEETVVQKDSSDDEAQPPQEEDEFDKLLQQQIDIARATPAPGSVKKGADKIDQWTRIMETPNRNDRSFQMPKATSSPSISDEQKERMLRNRKLAEERRLARLKQSTSLESNTYNTILEVNEPTGEKEQPTLTKDQNNVIEINEEIAPKKINRSNVIDSSDSEDECSVMAVNESIVVDIHNARNSDKENVDISNDEVINDEAEEIDNGVGIEKNTIRKVYVNKKKNKVMTNDKVINDDAKEIGDVEEMIVDDNNIVQNIVEISAVNPKTGDDISQSHDITEQNDDDTNDVDKMENNSEKIVEEVRNDDNNHEVDDKLSNQDITKDHTNNLIDDDNVKSKDEENEIVQEKANEDSKLNDGKVQAEGIAEEFTEEIMDVDFNDDF